MKRLLSKRYTAAKKLAALLNKKCCPMGDEVTVHLDEYEDTVLVIWEGGPFEWSVALTGGAQIYAGENGRYSQNNPWFSQVQTIERNSRVFFECQNSYSISVWEG
ncbi:hypothetical protein DRQ50_00195 [bacterium]|nr:MAG: hypothetical protein DRQ50_00195 [bacterium]